MPNNSSKIWRLGDKRFSDVFAEITARYWECTVFTAYHAATMIMQTWIAYFVGINVENVRKFTIGAFHNLCTIWSHSDMWPNNVTQAYRGATASPGDTKSTCVKWKLKVMQSLVCWQTQLSCRFLGDWFLCISGSLFFQFGFREFCSIHRTKQLHRSW